jgi:methylmalonyl-CoA mutase N-terminal domain/subunit
LVRVAYEALAAVLGGVQSMFTAAWDEPFALPSEESATLALRTQQILAYETGVAKVADPLGGSYFVEALTDEIERRAQELIDKVDELGGSVQAIDFIKNEIEESAFGYHERYRIEQDIVVGVNKFVEDTPEVPDILRVDPESEREQVARLKAFKSDRDAAAVERRLEEVRECARGTDNMLPVLRQALKDRCSIGEVCGAMRDVFGDYKPNY